MISTSPDISLGAELEALRATLEADFDAANAVCFDPRSRSVCVRVTPETAAVAPRRILLVLAAENNKDNKSPSAAAKPDGLAANARNPAPQFTDVGIVLHLPKFRLVVRTKEVVGGEMSPAASSGKSEDTLMLPRSLSSGAGGLSKQSLELRAAFLTDTEIARLRAGLLGFVDGISEDWLLPLVLELSQNWLEYIEQEPLDVVGETVERDDGAAPRDVAASEDFIGSDVCASRERLVELWAAQRARGMEASSSNDPAVGGVVEVEEGDDRAPNGALACDANPGSGGDKSAAAVDLENLNDQASTIDPAEKIPAPSRRIAEIENPAEIRTTLLSHSLPLFVRTAHQIVEIMHNDVFLKKWHFDTSFLHCAVCGDSKTGANFFKTSGCKHTACCRECFFQMAELHIREGSVECLKCVECGAGLQRDDVARALCEGFSSRQEGWFCRATTEVESDSSALSREEGGGNEEMSRNEPACCSPAEDGSNANDDPQAQLLRTPSSAPPLLRTASTAAADTLNEEGKSLLQRWLRLTQQRAKAKAENCVYCPKCYEPVLCDRQDSNFAQCFDCSPPLTFCGLCLHPWHPGSACDFFRVSPYTTDPTKTNADATRGGAKSMQTQLSERAQKLERERRRRILQEKLSLQYLTALCKPCPKCRAPIDKISGCNKMQCFTCRAKFCWQCGAVIENYDHFGSGRGKCRLFAVETVHEWDERGGAGHFGEHFIIDLDGQRIDLNRVGEEIVREQQELLREFDRMFGGVGPQIPKKKGIRGIRGVERRQRKVRKMSCGKCRVGVVNKDFVAEIRCEKCRAVLCGFCGQVGSECGGLCGGY